MRQGLARGRKPCFYLVLFGFFTFTAAWAQSAGGRLGDATVTPGLASKSEPYGFGSFEEDSSAGFTTRHYRKGNDGGIGSSYLQTTSATVESRPPVSYVSPATGNRASLRADLNNIRTLDNANFYPNSPSLESSRLRESLESGLGGYDSTGYHAYGDAQKSPAITGLSSDMFGRRKKERSFTFPTTPSSSFSSGFGFE